MTEQEARDWLLANGWTVERASLYDEEGIEGWCWSHPDYMVDRCEIGDWHYPPTVPDSLVELAEQAANVGTHETHVGTHEK